ncbi:autophagy protein Apg9-domain-containing protein [Mycena rosella]|uniref:Autophagy-related protein 9 n=1 Tax=Mycena rosella TaxID=1033263 RepID=A0AAD7H0L3_MYCRO|nr:autophagy protein Apg9-domain-containing protein [Mycena rosella]
MSTSNRSPRPLSGSRSFQASQSFYTTGGASSSRPFLNMLNPMARQYQGYSQANQSLLEEEDEARSSAEEENAVEEGRSRSTIFQSAAEDIPLSKSRTHRVSWDAPPSDTHTLHPNIQQEDALHERESSDDEVPQSFMIEATSKKSSAKGKSKSNSGRSQPLHSVAGRNLPPVLPTHTTSPRSPPPSTDDSHSARPASRTSNDHERPFKQMRGLDAYERALWNWVNVYNLDAFLQEVYYYYEGKGIYSIALSRGLNLLTVGFVISFSTFLLGCIDYSRIRPEKSMKLSDVVVGRCVSNFSGFTLIFFILFIAFYVWQIVTFVLSIFRLVDMYNFFTHLLKIPDVDIQTISWPEIVRRIGAIREDNPLTALSSNVQKTDDTTTAKLDAHDIANRILRQENYLIALFNKDLLDLRVPLPNMLKRFIVEEQGKGTMLTRALEWNLRFCLMEYLFDQHGKVRKVFLKSKNRPVLIEGLKRRFIFMGMLNAVFAPFIVLYLLMYSFFRYFEEYHKDPSTIGGRRYTSFAQWKFREFNELPHLFTRRLDESHPFANMYIGQFPNENMTLIMRFVAFVSGSFAAVLFLATVLDPDIFVHFEITPHRTVLFYLGVFGSVLAVARGMIPEENRVFDPEFLMTEVITFTHYMPDEWKGDLHSKRIHKEFGQLFAMKVLIFVEELISVVLTPFVLWFSLPDCAPAIIDFFREFTVHVDGRGYVCSFAEFNFERHGNVKFGAPTRIQDKRMVSNEGKMEKSFLNFKAANPDWNPTDPSGSLYLSRMADFSASHHPNSNYPNSILRRRPGAGPSAPELQVSAQAERKTDGSLGERAQEYDRALKQSQHAASRRRAGPAGSVLGMSAIAGLSASSVFGGLSMAQTAVLGDSQGSVQIGRAQGHGDAIMQEDIAADGGVGSGLGESYVDGGRQALARGGGGEEEDGDGDGLEDGGVLGLLAQIYGRREGPARVI